MTGFSSTWTAVHSEDGGGDGRRRYTMFASIIVAGGSGTLAIDLGGQTQANAGWSVVEWSGADTSGTAADAIVQTVVEDDSTDGSLDITLSAYSSSDNRPFVVGFCRGNTMTDLTLEGGWTELGSSGTDDATTSGWKTAADDTTVTINSDDSTPSLFGGIVSEILAASTSTQAPRSMHQYRMRRTQ
jgi:hypothetical protein